MTSADPSAASEPIAAPARGSMLPYWLTLAVAIGAAYGFYKVWEVRRFERGGSVSVPDDSPPKAKYAGPPLTEFTLTERNGQPLNSRDLRGKVWVASIFFAQCSGSCLLLNRELAEFHADPRFAGVTFVSITCDPQNDTLPALKEYARRFDADPERWRFARGDEAYVERVSHDMFQIAYKGKSHSDRAVIFDRSGKMRGQFSILDKNGPQRATFETVLLECLAEPAPAFDKDADSEPADDKSSAKSAEKTAAAAPRAEPPAR